jgi:hypothetical protein
MAGMTLGRIASPETYAGSDRSDRLQLPLNVRDRTTLGPSATTLDTTLAKDNVPEALETGRFRTAEAGIDESLMTLPPGFPAVSSGEMRAGLSGVRADDRRRCMGDITPGSRPKTVTGQLSALAANRKEANHVED